MSLSIWLPWKQTRERAAGWESATWRLARRDTARFAQQILDKMALVDLCPHHSAHGCRVEWVLTLLLTSVLGYTISSIRAIHFYWLTLWDKLNALGAYTTFYQLIYCCCCCCWCTLLQYAYFCNIVGRFSENFLQFNKRFPLIRIVVLRIALQHFQVIALLKFNLRAFFISVFLYRPWSNG